MCMNKGFLRRAQRVRKIYDWFTLFMFCLRVRKNNAPLLPGRGIVCFRAVGYFFSASSSMGLMTSLPGYPPIVKFEKAVLPSLFITL